MRIKGAIAIALGLSTSLIAFLALRAYYFEPNLCTMSWSRPVYISIDFSSPHSKVGSKYGLYLYREGGTSPLYESANDADNLGGTPVLFIPGNAGSYNQGRSLAATAASENPELDWFLVDFDEDFSAMHGKTLMDEARYVNDAIAHILELYTHRNSERVHPSSVIIVAHSMGGIVARTLVTLENYMPRSVNTILTLSTPHAYPPITFDRDITQLYDVVNQWWRNKPDDIEIALVSLAGGHSDLLVLPDMTVADSLGGISAFSYEIPGVGLGIDHLAIVWCSELKEAVLKAVADITDPTKDTRTVPHTEKIAKLTKRLKYSNPFSDESSTKLIASPFMFWGVPRYFKIDGPTEILLPALSSLVSYRFESSVPVNLSHRTEKERRSYGVTGDTTIMWYSAGPYVPFSKDTEKLTLEVDIYKAHSNTNGSAELKISVNWAATLANIAIHYRTLAACWPFAIVLITLMIQVSKQGNISFEQALYNQVLNRWFPMLALTLSILHCALTWPSIRAAVRFAQIPSEAKNVASLRYCGYDTNDLLLGVNDLEMFWMVPLLLSVAICAVIIVFLASSIIVELMARIFGKDSDKRNPENDKSKSKAVVKSRPGAFVFSITLLITGLYLIPYQVSTLALAIIQIFRIRDRRSIKFGVSQLLLWASVVDAPIVAVWARNLTIEWLWAFASVRNVASSLPLALFVLYGKPDSGFSSMRLPTVRILTLTVMAYIAVYAFTYGGLHAFMIHHLTSYFITVVLLFSAA